MQNLRDYQIKSVEAIQNEWEINPSTLLVMPTGTGKSVVLCEIARRLSPGKCLVISHLNQILNQLVRRFTDLGFEVEIEKAENRVRDRHVTIFNNLPSVTVASIQTLISKHGGKYRMNYLRPQNYSAIIIDEAHHSICKSYLSVIDYFRSENPSIKILGVTATPDRHDKRTLGKIFKSIAFQYSLKQAIQDGWLVNIKSQTVYIESIDFSNIKVNAGDFNQGELSDMLTQEKNLFGITDAVMQLIPNKRAVIFCVSVEQSEKYCNLFNNYERGSTEYIHGGMDPLKRMMIISRFRNGEIKRLVNCKVLGEGYDDPAIEAVVIAKPTLSRGAYVQMIGRGLRPLSDLVDHLSTADERRKTIAESSKPDCLILDFYGNHNRHSLTHTVDILSGDYSEPVIKAARRRIKKLKTAVNPVQILDEEKVRYEKIMEIKKELERKKLEMIRAKAKFSTVTVDPFNNRILPQQKVYQENRGPTEKQRKFLIQHGYDPDKLTREEARRIIINYLLSFRDGRATPRQVALLKRFYPNGNFSSIKKIEASRLIDLLRTNHWRPIPGIEKQYSNPTENEYSNSIAESEPEPENVPA
jgi:superfamily II DNA or RNA helicase